MALSFHVYTNPCTHGSPFEFYQMTFIGIGFKFYESGSESFWSFYFPVSLKFNPVCNPNHTTLHKHFKRHCGFFFYEPQLALVFKKKKRKNKNECRFHACFFLLFFLKAQISPAAVF